MVLTFTGTVSVATAGRDDVRLMLIAAIGCNIAWGFVDGVMYVLRTLVSRAREATFDHAVRAAAQPELAHRLIASQVGPMAAGLDASGLERVRQWIVDQPPPLAGRAHMSGGPASAVRWASSRVVFASTFRPCCPSSSSPTCNWRCASPQPSRSRCCSCAAMAGAVMAGCRHGAPAW
ncbi:MAG: hypothetical protein IPJ42_17970 [Betaproteobacteria bacterium]|nr:hypothetical protein [Betaproteobacteria bacterium]